MNTWILATACALAPWSFARPALRTRATDACATCHRTATSLSHPLGVRIGTATTLPLGPERTLTCTTCHAEPADDAAPLASTPHGSLRLPVAALCRSCHQDPDDVGGRVAHALLAPHAHRQRSVATVATGSAIDPETRVCLGCHDGTVARAAPPLDRPPDRRGLTLPGSHPVGVRYDDPRSSPRGARGLRTRAALPAEIRLADGRVTCATCHSPYAREPAMLAIGNRESRLCLTCHLK